MYILGIVLCKQYVHVYLYIFAMIAVISNEKVCKYMYYYDLT